MVHLILWGFYSSSQREAFWKVCSQCSRSICWAIALVLGLIKTASSYLTRSVVLRMSSIIFGVTAKRILWSVFCKRQLKEHNWFTDTTHRKLSAPLENLLLCLRLRGDVGRKQRCLGVVHGEKSRRSWTAVKSAEFYHSRLWRAAGSAAGWHCFV